MDRFDSFFMFTLTLRDKLNLGVYLQGLVISHMNSCGRE